MRLGDSFTLFFFSFSVYMTAFFDCRVGPIELTNTLPYFVLFLGDTPLDLIQIYYIDKTL